MPSQQQRAIAGRLALGVGPGKIKRKNLRKLPPQVSPLEIERRYRAEQLALVDRMREAAQPFFDAGPSLFIDTPKRAGLEDWRERIERAVADGATPSIILDADGRLIREMMAELRAAFGALLNDEAIDRLAHTVGDATSEWSRRQLYRQIKHAFGVDPFLTEPHLYRRLEAFAAENVSLIKDIPAKTASQIELMVTRAVADGLRWEQVAKELEERFDVARARARLIARDQVGKLYGQVAAERQVALGLTRFAWRNVGDRRVRPLHVERGGNIYLFSKPPDGELPGGPILCRCYPDPVLEDLLG